MALSAFRSETVIRPSDLERRDRHPALARRHHNKNYLVTDGERRASYGWRDIRCMGDALQRARGDAGGGDTEFPEGALLRALRSGARFYRGRSYARRCASRPRPLRALVKRVHREMRASARSDARLQRLPHLRDYAHTLVEDQSAWRRDCRVFSPRRDVERRSAIDFVFAHNDLLAANSSDDASVCGWSMDYAAGTRPCSISGLSSNNGFA